jgi:hypothetical protein
MKVKIDGKTFTYQTFFLDKKEGRRERDNWIKWKRKQGFMVRSITKNVNRKGKAVKIHQIFTCPMKGVR